MQLNKTSVFALVWALFGFSLVIIVHECGHFIVARFLGITCPVFSIGFGPSLFSVVIARTTFQIAIIPLGGYVLLELEQFNEASFMTQFLITVAGIFFNLIFAYFLFLFLSMKKRVYQEEEFFIELDIEQAKRRSMFSHAALLFQYVVTNFNALIIKTFAKGNHGIIGPISIINGLIESAKDGAFLYILSIAMLNINIALFNLLPIPFLDGGKLVQITIEWFFGKQSLSVVIAVSFFLLFFIMTVISQFQKISGYEQNAEMFDENQQ